MATRTSHNKNSSAVKRILSEARELASDDSTEYTAAPLEDDIFEWHATIRGPSDTEFEGGLYHARITLPPEYPFKAPSVMVMTPNGRFELNKKLCISFTSYHEELWQPAWGVRTAIVGLQGFFPAKGEAAMGVGILEYPIVERKRLAALSRQWVCPDCQMSNHELLPDPPKPKESDAAQSTTPEPNPQPNPAATPAQQTDAALSTDTAPSSLATPSSPSSVPIITIEPASPDSHRSSLPPTSPSNPTPESDSIPTRTTTPTPSSSTAPAPMPSEQQLLQPYVQPVSSSRATQGAPWWLDAFIVFISILLALLAGKRLVHWWDYMLRDDLLTL